MNLIQLLALHLLLHLLLLLLNCNNKTIWQ
jgi:hypothetical protein